MAYLNNDSELLEPFRAEIKKFIDRNNELSSLINDLSYESEQLPYSNESLDKVLDILDNFKKFYDFTKDFEERKRLIRSLVKFVVWDSETRALDIVLVGCDEERPR